MRNYILNYKNAGWIDFSWHFYVNYKYIWSFHRTLTCTCSYSFLFYLYWSNMLWWVCRSGDHTYFFCITEKNIHYFSVTPLSDKLLWYIVYYTYTIILKKEEAIHLNRQNPTLITLSLGLTALIGTLNITMFNIALPAMMTYFDAPLSTVQWLTSGFLLAAGMIIPAAGFLGDRIGYKRILCIILLAVLALSIIGPFSWCIEALILVRFLFGLFSGLLSQIGRAHVWTPVTP